MKNKWISVKEKLPKKDGWVLAVIKMYDGTSIIDTDYFLRKEKKFYIDVTHWMNLPSAPGKEDHD